MRHGYPLIRRVIHGTDWTKKVAVIKPVVLSPSIVSLLEKPTWSVRSLLPGEKSADAPREITREKLHHLLKLSALPLPKDQEEEDRMLNTLESQIHFVKEVQKVDTTGVEPLQAIRDETQEGIEEQTVNLADLQPFLDREDKVGKNGTVRRRKDDVYVKDGNPNATFEFDPFKLGAGEESRRTGKYFFVKREKKVRNMEPVE